MGSKMKEEILDGLQKRYPHVHPLMFHRSCEKAINESELFDILELMPKKYPMIWDEVNHCWITNEDLFLSSRFKLN